MYLIWLCSEYEPGGLGFDGLILPTVCRYESLYVSGFKKHEESGDLGHFQHVNKLHIGNKRTTKRWGHISIRSHA